MEEDTSQGEGLSLPAHSGQLFQSPHWEGFAWEEEDLDRKHPGGYANIKDFCAINQRLGFEHFPNNRDERAKPKGLGFCLICTNSWTHKNIIIWARFRERSLGSGLQFAAWSQANVRSPRLLHAALGLCAQPCALMSRCPPSPLLDPIPQPPQARWHCHRSYQT